MKCKKCGEKVGILNHYYIPFKTKSGFRICLKCARKNTNFVSLV